MKFTARWVGADGVEHVTSTIPFDVIGWERWSGSKISSFQSSGVGLEDLARLIHFAARRQGDAPDDFDEWMGQVLDFEPGEAPTPTPPGGAPSGD